MIGARERHFTALLIVAALTSGCGLPAHRLTRLDRKTVPFGLLQTAPPTAPPQGRGPHASVYFVANGRLVAVSRLVVGQIQQAAARALIAGPTAAESARGLSSDVPAQTRLTSLDLTGSVATVDLSDEFGAVGGSDQVLAVAQFVYTLTASHYIDSVRFAINGKFIEVPDASGSLSSQPRSRKDYRSLAPRGSIVTG